MRVAFRPIARLLAKTVHPAPVVDVTRLQPALGRIGKNGQGVLLTANHFTAPDFHAWWFVILISAILPVEIHWIVTSGWTGPGWVDRLTHWVFPRGARLLGFTPMPAMPPNPRQVEQRAEAVREVLSYARNTPGAVVGITPEGGDTPGGVLWELPPGVGRFMQLISQYCPQVIPVGVWKEEGLVHLKFGSPYTLVAPVGLEAEGRDRWVGETVMRHIAALLPERLRGRYG